MPMKSKKPAKPKSTAKPARKRAAPKPPARKSGKAPGAKPAAKLVTKPKPKARPQPARAVVYNPEIDDVVGAAALAEPAAPGEYPEKVRFILEVLDNMKALDVEVYHVVEKTILADYFLVCTGGSSTHTSALADEVYLKCKGKGWPLGRLEGDANPSWKILDYGDVVLHIFLEETRAFYKLEEIWGEGPKSKGAVSSVESQMDRLMRTHPRAGSGATSALKRRRGAARA